MGEDISSGAKLGIILIILCSLLAIVLSLLLMMKNITNSGSATLQSGLDQMLSSRFDDYDQRVVSGTQVSAAVKLFEGQSVGIVVVTGACQNSGATARGGYNYGAVLDSHKTATETNNDGAAYICSTDMSNYKTDGNTYYTIDLALKDGAVFYNMNIKPMSRTGSEPFVRDSAKFMAELIKDTTGTTVGICFTQTT